ncbi:MAG: GNAT family N-acetyltransferase [Turicibacter sp.]
MNWKIKEFRQLSVDELYGILKLRNEVFVVEQTCIYSDTDDIDQKCLHVFLEENDKIFAYARVIPKQVKFEEASLGRVIVAPEVRKEGYGKILIEKALQCIEEQWGKVNIRIEAQAHLTKFYGEFGFCCISDVFLDDGIPHVIMLRDVKL